MVLRPGWHNCNKTLKILRNILLPSMTKNHSQNLPRIRVVQFFSDTGRLYQIVVSDPLLSEGNHTLTKGSTLMAGGNGLVFF